MARVKRVDNSRKDHQCGRGHVIPAGDSYLTASPGYRGRPKYRCLAHPFRPSELTTSLRSEPMAAVESFEDQVSAGIDSIEDLESAWQELVDAIQEYVDNRQSALDEWENGNSQLEELLDTAQNALDEAEQFSPEEFDEDEPQEEDFKDTDKGRRKYDEALAEWNAAREEHVTEQVNEASEVAGSLEF